jgi:hypothetical protein
MKSVNYESVMFYTSGPRRIRFYIREFVQLTLRLGFVQREIRVNLFNDLFCPFQLKQPKF